MAYTEYDENDAIQYIRDHVDENICQKYEDDDILLLIDIMFEFSEKYGDSDDFDDDIDKLVDYVKKQLLKDKDNVIEGSDVQALVMAELDYENCIEV